MTADERTEAVPGTAPRWTRRDWCLAWALTLVALAVRLYHLDYRSLWTDEFHTLDPILMPLHEMLAERLRAGHLPAYFLVMKLWTTAAGTSEWALRFPSAVFGLFLVPASVLFCRNFVPRPLTYAVALAACFNGMAVWSSQETRMYSMLSVAATLTHYCYFMTVVNSSSRAWIRYFLMVAVSLSIHVGVLVHITGHLLFSFVWRRRIPDHWRAARRVLIALPLVLLPGIVAYLLVQQKADAHFDPQNPFAIVRQIGKLLAGNVDKPEWFSFVRIAMAAVCLAGAYAGWRRPPAGEAALPNRTFLAFCLAAFATPLLILWSAQWFVRHVFGPEKYFIASIVPLWVFMLWGLSCLPARMRPYAWGALGMALAVGLAEQWADRGKGGREMVRDLVKMSGPNDVVIIRRSGGTYSMLKYYGAAHLTICPIRARASHDDIFDGLASCLAGHPHAWLFLYRGENQKSIQTAIRRHPDFFRMRKRWEYDSGELWLLDISERLSRLPMNRNEEERK